MKKLIYLIVLVLILGLVLAGCLLSNVGQVPTSEQSGITYLTKNSSPPVLVGLWHFDDDALDSSGNNNDGTVYGGESWVDGKFGNALSFDGVNNWVDIPDLSIAGDFSIEFWVNFDPGISNQDAIVGPEVVVAQDINFWGGKCRWFTGDDSGFPRDVIIANTSAQPNTWEYYAITRSGDTLTLYLNGVADVTKDIFDINTFPFRPMVIGRGNAGYFDGLIDEVRIWDGALTGANIEYNYSLRNIAIDIKPGSDPNSINLGSKGVIPVAILGSDSFNADIVDPLTVKLAGSGVKIKGNSGNAGSLKDANGDGYPDLVVQVYTENLGLVTSAVNAVLNAYTYAGPAITGSDSIQIVPQK